ncbi:hypothetical protein [Shewanella surugensis]|uniref:Uncharacterized protein n=1 Tax=Shewanella surugensis TaxID=212020 RepID=A0ABT0LI10_9GAMM|nr:hypothetical protein [Shewanella surugensis]MCL1127351.1 hypothetical protein [Shewanella surugensis]
MMSKVIVRVTMFATAILLVLGIARAEVGYAEAEAAEDAKYMACSKVNATPNNLNMYRYVIGICLLRPVMSGDAVKDNIRKGCMAITDAVGATQASIREKLCGYAEDNIYYIYLGNPYAIEAIAVSVAGGVYGTKHRGGAFFAFARDAEAAGTKATQTADHFAEQYPGRINVFTVGIDRYGGTYDEAKPVDSVSGVNTAQRINTTDNYNAKAVRVYGNN